MSSLYLACSALIWGDSVCSACIERNCLIVSGSISVRTTIVSAMIDIPQLNPKVSWKNWMIASKTEISGWKMSWMMFAKTNGIGQRAGWESEVGRGRGWKRR